MKTWPAVPKVILTFLSLCLLYQVTGSTLVLTPSGPIRGKTETGPNNKTYISFRNVPYAKPPLGDLRFAKPEPYPVFENTYEATGEIVQCIQPAMFVVDGDQGREDCLILNIYVKDIPLSPNHRKKVLVFFHGGSYLLGSSRFFEPGFFVTDHDVIVVTVNYRLGIMGFLSSKNEASPGNYGLWDQALALNWTKKNIASFGGDSNDITVGGSSSGASSLTFLELSPLTKDLFTKAYTHGGSATSLSALSTNPKLDFITLAKSAGCLTDYDNEEIDVEKGREIVQCLRQLNATYISSMQPFSLEKTSFVPVVDGDIIPKHPLKLLLDDSHLQSVKLFDKKHLIAFNNNDKAPLVSSFRLTKSIIYSNNQITDEEKKAAWESITTNTIFNALKFRLDTDTIPDALIDNVHDWYEARVGDDIASNIVSDLSFTIPAFDFLNTLTKHHPSSSWLLYFNYYPKFVTGPMKGMVHVLDLLYWMDYPLLKLEQTSRSGIVDEFTEEDVQLKNLFSAILAEFMKTGKPDQVLKSWKIKEWPAFNAQCDKYLNFNLRPSVQRHLDKERRHLWEDLVPRYAAELGMKENHLHTDL